MTKNRSIILLSGGLDSLVSLGVAKEEYNIQLALTFDYGQKSLKQEVEASKKITEFYEITHKIIELPFLKSITNTALVSNEEVPTNDLKTKDSAKAVWVPNRNGLFLNIAASYADSYEYTHVLFGANKEESATFPDNSQEFVNAITNSFKYSTMVQTKVVAPLISYNKNDIVRIALEHSIPLELARSCYNNGEINCGICESCIRLKSALQFNNANEYIERLF